MIEMRYYIKTKISNINMNIFITILIFIMILLVYLHFMSEFKYVKKFSIYDVEYTNRNELQKICELKQPFVFDLQLQSEDKINKEQNMCIFDNSDNEFVNLTYSALEELFEKDKDGVYYSMNNFDFAKNELPITFSELNKYVNPYFSYNTVYDVLMGSCNSYTPLVQMRETDLFLYIKKGNIDVKMMTYNKDLDLTNICLWNVNDASKYEVTDIHLTSTCVLYIPSWCLYTIKFNENALIYSITHQTPTNFIVNIPTYCVELLQKHNTEEKVLKTIEFPKNKSEESDVSGNTITNIENI